MSDRLLFSIESKNLLDHPLRIVPFLRPSVYLVHNVHDRFLDFTYTLVATPLVKDFYKEFRWTVVKPEPCKSDLKPLSPHLIKEIPPGGSVTHPFFSTPDLTGNENLRLSPQGLMSNAYSEGKSLLSSMPPGWCAIRLKVRLSFTLFLKGSLWIQFPVLTNGHSHPKLPFSYSYFSPLSGPSGGVLPLQRAGPPFCEWNRDLFACLFGSRFDSSYLT